MATQLKPPAERPRSAIEPRTPSDRATYIAFIAFMTLLVLAFIAVGWEILTL